MRTLSTKKQVILYGCAGLGVNMLNLIVGSYLCSALLTGGFKEHVESWTYLNKNLVVAGLWAVLCLVAKIIDGVIDLPMSSLTDNLRTRWGKRRPSILIGLIPTVIAYLLFLIPINGGESIANTLWFAGILCLFYSAYTLTMVTYYATFAEIVEKESDRVLLSNVKSVCDVVYFIFGYALVPLLVNSGINIRITALIFLPLCLTMLIPLFMIKEDRTDGKGGEVQEKVHGVSLVESFTYSFKNKEFIYWLCTVFVMNFGLQLFLSGINEYFSSTGLNMTLIMASAFAPVPFTLILYNKIVKKKGLRFAFQYILLVFAAGMVLMAFCQQKETFVNCTSAELSGYEAGTDYLVSIPVSDDASENEVLTITADENGVLTVTENAVGKSIGVTQKRSWGQWFAMLCAIIVSFAIGAFFSVSYTIPSELAAQENARSGICASSMYFAVEGLFEGVSAGLASGVVLTALKSHQGAIAWMTVIVAAACVAACIMARFLPASIAYLGKEKVTE